MRCLGRSFGIDGLLTSSVPEAENDKSRGKLKFPAFINEFVFTDEDNQCPRLLTV
jgi:hypothetical protein